ncbi:hypothetical protein [Rhodovulum sp. ES.010]|nr:hypothetical protein [Rhodovulum sp. ES.010]
MILSSEAADPSLFPPLDREGFVDTADHRIFYDRARRGDLTIAMTV